MGTGEWLLDCIATQCPPQLGKTAVTCDGSFFTGLASTHCTSRNEFQHPVSSTSRMHQGTGSGVLPYPQ